MDLEDIKSEKLHLDCELGNLFRTFEYRTGMKITQINICRNNDKKQIINQVNTVVSVNIKREN